MTLPDARLPLLDIDDMPETARDAYAAVAESRGGRMLNLFRAMANAPEAMETVAAVGGYLRYRGTLDDALRELAILTVARETGATYEWTQHWPIAEKAGIAPKVLEKVRSRALEQEDTPQGRALLFVRLACNNEAVSDTLLAAVRQDFGNGGLVELTMLAGYYGMLARFLRIMQVPNDA